MYDRKVMLRLFWTIIIIISLSIMTMMLEGCSSNQKQREVKVYNIDTLNTDYVIYVIDSCEYVVFYSGGSTWGSHKGNCSNPIHANH
jgi:hypothetical protein